MILTLSRLIDEPNATRRFAACDGLTAFVAIANLIQQRQTTRQQRDFVTADEIRDRLAAVGITVVDQPNGEVRRHRQYISDRANSSRHEMEGDYTELVYLITHIGELG
ncbi:MAG: hypothetical protein AAGG53_01595 [Cyanobacteria bacterium P01_H01_bin.152]